MRIEIVDHIPEEIWLTLMEKDENASFFHHPVWLNAITSSYRYKLMTFLVQDDAGQILGGLPVFYIDSVITGKRAISIPFSDYFAPLVASPQATTYLVDALERYRVTNNIPHLCIRHQLPQHQAILEDKRYVLHKLVLQSDPSLVFGTFAKKFRQYPRKAERDGLHVVSTNQKKDIDIFYSLHLKNRQKLGVPVQPKRFFDLIWENVISQGLGHIILVSNDTKVISGAILLYYGSKIMIKYSASDPLYLHERCHYYTFWKSIEWACLNGFSEMDFGRTDIVDDGLRSFKSGWGTEESLLVYSYIGTIPQDSISGMGANIVGLIIRRSPEFVARGIGQLLYKHFA